MTDNDRSAYKRLGKKLTELRKTLRKDERDILDRMVTGKNAEVKGHELEQADESFYALEQDAYSYESEMLA
ncbi:MAG: hypothetical protein ACM3JD_10105 [Rudaea sp.]